MHHLANGTAISCAQLFQNNQIFAPKIELEFQADLQSVCPLTFLIPDSTWYLCIAFGWFWRLWRCTESQAFDVLPL